MSARNGDKARFGRLRKQRILLRKSIQTLRGAMQNRAANQPDNPPSSKLGPIPLDAQEAR